ncbi:MAG: hypothetical protein JWL83_832 [Actinomycetia bacterium]|nr:hypothetical protein [Actinomycetes bacterium]
MPQVKAAAVALLIAVGLVACGSSGGASVSQSQYKTKTDAACKSLQKDLNVVVAKMSLKTPAGIKAAATAYADILTRVANDMRKIGYPAGKKDLANQFYAALDQAAAKLKSDPNVLKSSAVPAEFTKISSLAKQLGLTNCGGAGG